MAGQLKKNTMLRKLETGWLEMGNALGPILLFLHGYPDTPESWQFQLEYFSKDYHIVAPYNRGAKPSFKGHSLKRYSLSSSVLDLMQILKVVNPEQDKKIICIGHDIGAVLAWKLATFLGNRLQKLIIINGLSLNQMLKRLTSAEQLMRSWYIFLFLIPFLPERIIKRFGGQLLRFAHKLGGLPPAKRPKLNHVIAGIVNPINHYRAFARQLPLLLKAREPQIKCPLLVIFGNKDPFLLPPSEQEMTPYADNFSIRIVQGGHWLHRETPDAINDIITNFLLDEKTHESRHQNQNSSHSH